MGVIVNVNIRIFPLLVHFHYYFLLFRLTQNLYVSKHSLM
jgi:hypothetical protein